MAAAVAPGAGRDRARGARSIEEIGFPVGRPQTIVVDLAGHFLSAVARGPHRDQHAHLLGSDPRRHVATARRDRRTTRLDPAVADLRWRGFSAEMTPDGREPFGYDYQRVSPTSPWKLMAGRYTRDGDVRPLCATTDDMFVISRPGDEIALSFDAAALPRAARRLDADVPAVRGRVQQGDEPTRRPRIRRRRCRSTDDALSVPAGRALSRARRRTRLPGALQHADRGVSA